MQDSLHNKAVQTQNRDRWRLTQRKGLATSSTAFRFERDSAAHKSRALRSELATVHVGAHHLPRRVLHFLAQLPSMSYSPSSSSNSPSSSAVASWYCWYSDTKSFILDSASVNSISSMPSPVYQWMNALRRNMAVKNSATRLNISWIAVELPKKVTAIFKPFGGISQMPVLMLLGIHSTKYDEFLFCTFNICSSTSFALILPLKNVDAVRYLPCLGSAAHIIFLASNIC